MIFLAAGAAVAALALAGVAFDAVFLARGACFLVAGAGRAARPALLAAAFFAAGVAAPLVAERFAGALEDAAFLTGGACLRGAAFFGIGTNSAMEGGGP